MEQSKGLTLYETKKVTEQTPLKDPATQTFFKKWCEINDSITPQFITRDAWDQRKGQPLLEPNQQGKKSLYLPEDLHLWELVPVVEAIDTDTYANNPEL